MKLEGLKHQFPTKLWRERMIEFDDQFNEACIKDSERILNQYVDELIQVANQEKKIMDAVRKVVVRFNDINDLHDYFIETMEREELYDFIDEAARLSGLKVVDDEDITEEWREW
jgi:GTP1/Obg family GTP-binding protein